MSKRRFDTSNPRYWRQNATLAIRSVEDALVELITNCDDAYSRAGRKDCIEIEVERRRRGSSSIVRVRDFATGLDPSKIDQYLGGYSDRHASGLTSGMAVRGTNSRGAKDVAILGRVTFESICNGIYCRRVADKTGHFEGEGHTQEVDPTIRKRVGIPTGSGLVVTLEVEPGFPVARHESLADDLSNLVALRDILKDRDNSITLIDSTQRRTTRIQYVDPESTVRVDETISVPGYPGATAKLTIKRAKTPLTNESPKSRESGVIVKSGRAIHQATMFSNELEHDPAAARFFGTVKCDYINVLWNEYDEKCELGQELPANNNIPIIDPTRQVGLRREHPFTKALFGECVRRLRPLVEEERRALEKSRQEVESKETRHRLGKLERLASQFIKENELESDDEAAPETGAPEGGIARRGFALSPPFTQLVVGETRRFTLSVDTKAFPSILDGHPVQLHGHSDDIALSEAMVFLHERNADSSILHSSWMVTARTPTPATGLIAHADFFQAEAMLEILASPKDRYIGVSNLRFERARYLTKPGVKKTLRLLAPLGLLKSSREYVVKCNLPSWKTGGEKKLIPHEKIGIAIGEIYLTCPSGGDTGIVTAEYMGTECECRVICREPEGESIKIKIVDEDFENQRCRWRGTTLEIGARHSSTRRYLGPAENNFPGQEKLEFRVLVAEIVAYAVAERILQRNTENNPILYQGYDLDNYLFERDRLLSRFLPLAHDSQVR